ncbi:MAG: hypothetical protein AB7O52_02255 [Planctomycetota bacterium]
MQPTSLPTSLPDDLIGRVRELYGRLEQELEPHQHLCRRSGVCCDFRVAGHTLFASELEVQYLLAHRAVDWEPEGELCPFWKGGLCHARAERPLGCRTYFCDPGWRDQGAAIHERYHRDLANLAEAAGLEYRYGPWVDRLRALSRSRSERKSELPLDPPSGAT